MAKTAALLIIAWNSLIALAAISSSLVTDSNAACGDSFVLRLNFVFWCPNRSAWRHILAEVYVNDSLHFL